MKQINSKKNDSNDKKRLKEILEVLMDNDVNKPLSPKKLCSILQDLGEHFISLGKIMSSRQNILPKDFREELATLEDNAVAMSYEELQKIIELEYGVSIDSIFTEFDETPIELSSITQSHIATLQNSNLVIVKFQRSGIYDTISQDISLLKKALDVLKLEYTDNNKISLSFVLDELWSICQQELNFSIEAANTEKFYNLNLDNDLIISPKIENKYTTSNILVMEYINGIKINDIEQLSSKGYNTKEIATNLANNYAKQFLYDGFFHAAPTLDNILIKNGKICWRNFSVVGTLSKKDIESLAKAINAIKNQDVVDLKSIILNTAVTTDDINNSKLYSSIENLFKIYKSSEKEFKLANIIKDTVVLLNENSISLPEQFSKLFIGLISIDSVLDILDPGFSIISIFCEQKNQSTDSKDITENTKTSNNNSTEQAIKNIQNSDSKNNNSNDSLDNTIKLNNNLADNPNNQQISDSSTNDKNKAFNLNNQQLQQLNPKNEKSQQVSLSYNSDNNTIDMVAQISDILKMAVDGQTKVNLQVNVSDDSISSIDKILNKLLICIISVSCLIGACTIVATDLEPKYYDLPVIGLILFVISIVLLSWLAIRIIRKK